MNQHKDKSQGDCAGWQEVSTGLIMIEIWRALTCLLDMWADATSMQSLSGLEGQQADSGGDRMAGA